ncbi:hypothetical protein FRB99_000397 [Tulasnella sp. 403]|nr:hypothetical protein FRB99_000397 [Tulasnella sp. 403]
MSISSLNDIVNLVHNPSSTPTAIAPQLKTFAKRDVAETIFASFGADGQDPLTVLHPQMHTLGALYLLSECWTQALPVLAVPLAEIDKNLCGVTYLDNLTYYYLGGVIYGVLKRWSEAEEFFEIAVSAPAQVTSAIQVEAYKKLTLIQLILYGKTKPLPKYVATPLTRQLKQPAYQHFIKNYPSAPAALNSIVEKEIQTYMADGNVGLIKQAIRHAPRWVVRKLTDTYLSLSLEDIARATGNDVKSALGMAAIEEATLLILGMIERNEIYATLTPSTTGNPGSAIVTFRDPPPPNTFDPSLLEKILRDAQSQGAQLNVLDKELGRNKLYLAKACKERESSSMQYDDMEGEYGRIAGDWD